MTAKNTNIATLHDYKTGEAIRPATAAELAASIDAAKHDGGAGAISVDGRSCYVEGANAYDYATDGTSGMVQAESLSAAYDMLRAKITDSMISDGATLWVAEQDGSNRLTMGVDRE